jgi:hypothetical protein
MLLPETFSLIILQTKLSWLANINFEKEVLKASFSYLYTAIPIIGFMPQLSLSIHKAFEILYH